MMPIDDAVTIREARERIEIAEKLSPAGTFEHSQYVKAALLSEWPLIRSVFLSIEARAAPH